MSKRGRRGTDWGQKKEVKEIKRRLLLRPVSSNQASSVIPEGSTTTARPTQTSPSPSTEVPVVQSTTSLALTALGVTTGVVPELEDRDPKASGDEPPACTTTEGDPGKCQDLSNCPQLLLDLTKLRQSICFKSLFVPGVCCPIDRYAVSVPVPM
jgi:hypothetical protein